MDIYNKFTEYGLRGLIALAKDSKAGKRVLLRDLCSKASIPLPFTRKPFQILVKYGYLSATRGPRGGYSLEKHPKNIHITELIKIWEGPKKRQPCPLGPSHCHYDTPCKLRKIQIDASRAIRKKLKTLNLEELIKDGPI